jgi:hypothetical protein
MFLAVVVRCGEMDEMVILWGLCLFHVFPYSIALSGCLSRR